MSKKQPKEVKKEAREESRHDQTSAGRKTKIEQVSEAEIQKIAIDQIPDKNDKKDIGKSEKKLKSSVGKGKRPGMLRSIQGILINISIVPLLILGVILTVSMAGVLNSNMEKELAETLDVAANSLYNTYSLLAPGDYRMDNGRLYKGETLLTGKYEVVDALKTAYKLDISLYYGDTRVLTTIMDDNGRRMVGEKAAEQAVNWTLNKDREYFVKNVKIGSQDYYGYYVPMLARDGSVVGMAFAGRPVAEVRRIMLNAIVKAVVISLIAIVITLLVCMNANRHITKALQAIQKYLGLLADGNFDMKMPVSVSRREDEIGDMGRNAVEVCAALEKKITTDPLTGLLNRRACNAQLEKMLAHINRDETARMTVTIGDIDFFKSVNDTYGHECGDIVLKTISDILAEEMKDKGIVARWGGEEFLVVYSSHIDDMLGDLNEMLWRIRSHIFDYEGFEPFQVTMTFGVNGKVWNKTQDEVIKEADECLYYGKETGRNKIVCTDGRVLLPDGEFSTVAAEINRAQQQKAEESDETEDGATEM